MKRISLVFLAILLAVAMPLLAQEPKNPAPSGGSVTPLFGGGGGPDNFGYTFIDGGGCGFQFVDISGTGTMIVDGDDTASAPVALQGPFNFYGDDLTELVMAANGYLSTDPTDTGPDLSNDCPLPAPPSTGGGARIYPLHDDLDLEAGIGQGFFEYFASCPRPSSQFPGADLGCHIFQWDEVSQFPGGGGAAVFDIQTILYDNSFEIVFQHDDRNPDGGAGSTTGIQNMAADDGLTFACDAPASIPTNSAQCFMHPNPDVELLPAPPAVPAMSTWSIIALAMLLMIVGSFLIRRVDS